MLLFLLSVAQILHLLDSAKIACVLDPKWIVAPRYLGAKPVVDFLLIETSSSAPLLVKTFLWTRDSSPVILLYLLGSILHLNEGRSGRLKIIKRSRAFGTRYFE